MIYKEVSKSDFVDEFRKFERDNFSYKGLCALYDYLYDVSEEIYDKGLELDVVALCCEYTEYENAKEASDVNGRYYDINDTAEKIEACALEFLNDRTTVIKFDGGIIIADF